MPFIQKLMSAASFGIVGQLPFAVTNTDAKLPFQRWAPFLTNHDQERSMTTFKGDVGAARIAATALLTMPGLPFVYYGEELGMLGTKPDEQIRTPMQWSADDGGGFTTGRPWEPLETHYRDTNVAAEADDPASLLSLYRQLIQLHTSTPALGHGDFTALKSSSPNVAAFVRQAGDDAVLVVLNFGKQPVADLKLALDKSGLAPGQYQLQALLTEASAAPLTVADGGAVADYAPLPAVEARTGYVFKLAK